MTALIPFGGVAPRVHPSAYVQESARVIGDVVVGPQSSLWFGVVVRADVNSVAIGARTNLQDHVTVHVTHSRWPTKIGDDVTVAHKVMLHGCTIGDRCLIGIAAVVLDGVEIAPDCLVAAGSLLAPGKKFPARCLILGSPARAVRELREDELAYLCESAANYVGYAAEYRSQGIE